MRTRENRNCFRCDNLFNELYRCKVDESGNWIFLCRSCLQDSKVNNLFYQYGGTWKSEKRN